MRSEPAIIAGISAATLDKHPVDWHWLVEDYAHTRPDRGNFPEFADFNAKLQQPGGFYLGNAAARRTWNTASGRAQFSHHPLPLDLLPEQASRVGDTPDLILQTLRSHDQYNTSLYGLNDRYRGVKGMRKVVFVSPSDIERLGFENGDVVDRFSLWNDGIERKVRCLTLLAYDTPRGQDTAYYPEANPLVPLDSFGEGSYTPTSKFIAIKLRRTTGKRNFSSERAVGLPLRASSGSKRPRVCKKTESGLPTATPTAPSRWRPQGISLLSARRPRSAP